MVLSTSGQWHKVQHYHGCYDPLQYPILLPRGEIGWHQNILYPPTSSQVIDTFNQASSSNSMNFSSVEDIFTNETTSSFPFWFLYYILYEYICKCLWNIPILVLNITSYRDSKITLPEVSSKFGLELNMNAKKKWLLGSINIFKYAIPISQLLRWTWLLLSDKIIYFKIEVNALQGSYIIEFT